MTVATPTCKLCGYAASSTDVEVFGPELFKHIEVTHPEVWKELLLIGANDTDGQHRLHQEEK